MSKLVSGRVKKTPQSGITSDRYEFLGLEQAEPDLGDPLVGPSSITAKPYPIGAQYVLINVGGQTGERYWIRSTDLIQPGLTPGSFTIFNNGTQVGAANSFNIFNFVGTGVTVDFVGSNSEDQTGIATVRIEVVDVQGPGNVYEISYHDPITGFLKGATGIVFRNNNVGIGSTIPTKKLDVLGNAEISGTLGVTTVSAGFATVTTLSIGSSIRLYGPLYDYLGNSGASGAVLVSNGSNPPTWEIVSIAATSLENPRTFEITGDIVASPIAFDGTGNVSLAATIQPNSVALGTDTTGDYVQSISGTSNQITVTSGTGEGSTPTLSLPTNLVVPQDLTVTRDLQVDRNLNVTGNITIGGTSALINVPTLTVFDPDIVLGYRTDAFGNDSSNDNTANHGGVAVASTEGTPLVDLFIAGIETAPATYKKIMWFKEGTFAGLGTDAWLFNYAVGIGSTQFPTGTRLAAGSIQFTENDLAVVRNISASGIITATTFYGDGSNLTNISANSGNVNYADVAGIATYATTSGIATYADVAGIATYADVAGIATYSTTSGIATYANVAGIATYATTSGIATYADVAGIATYATTSGIATYATTAGISTVAQGLTGTPNLNVGIVTATEYYGVFKGTIDSGVSINSSNYANVAGIATYATTSGIATYSTTSGIATYANVAGIATYATTSGIATYSTTSGIATYANIAGIATYAGVSGIATVAQGLTGTPNLNVGIVTATEYYGVFKGTIDSGVSINSSNYANVAGIATSVIGGIGSVTQLQVTGISTFTNGPVLVGSATSTGTATQRLQVTGGAYVSGNVGIGSTIPTVPLSVVGNANFTGVVTALSFSGNASSATYATLSGVATYATTAGIATNVIGGIGSVTQLQVTGISTFTNGPVLVGSATSTGTALQRLQVTGGAYVSDNVGIGSTNPSYKLYVVGDTFISGILTANRIFSNIYGEFTGGGISGTNIVGTALSISGISTFTNGPVFIGSGTSTGTATQRLQVTGGAYVSGNVGIATTNPLQPLQVGSGTTIVIIDALGNVGIGTTNATSKLHVVGSALITGVSTIGNFRITPIGTGATVGGIGVTYYGDGSQLSGVVSPSSNGEFYTGVSSSLQLTPLSYETSIYTFPSTAGKQYVIESINVANVDTSVGVGTTVNIIASIQNSTGEQTYIAYNVPIVNGGLIELLKNPIVAGPSDVMKMWVTDGNYIGVNNATEVYMNYTEFTSTEYISEYASTVSIATTDPTGIYTSTTYPSTIEAIHFANRTDIGDYPVSVSITNGTTTTYLAKNLIIPRYATVDILDRPKRVEVNGVIKVEVGQTSTIDVIIAGKQITS